MAFLKVCIHNYFDGFERMDNAIEIQTPFAQIPRKIAHRSPFLVGTGVAYNEAKRVTGLGGRSRYVPISLAKNGVLS